MADRIHKILVIDNDYEIILAVTAALKGEEFSVISSSNSFEAIKLAEKERPHVVLVELLMPNLNGIDICIELRHKPELSNTFIVFHSERKEEYSQIAAFNAGADDYIIKPIKPRVLICRLKALLKRYRSQHQEEEKIKIEGLIIDRERYSIFKDGEEIVLPRKAFELLSLLYDSPNKICSRKKISDMIWGQDVFLKNRTIDVHICKLREKLGNKYIKTIKGIGYKLEL